MTDYRTSTYLTDKAAFARLQTLASELGYVQSRGVGAGTVGSVSALMSALADGAVIALRASLLAEVVALLTTAHESGLPHEPGRAEVAAALRLLGHDPEPDGVLPAPES